ncbi:MAG: hypothetical protein H7247_11935 [Polaromonas sp.]|nr:hypothetical protein [Gemmatimonadaceae bacterium]
MTPGRRSVLVRTRFGLLRAALNDVSDALVFPDRYSADRLMRQVTNEARWRRLD